MAVTQLKVLFGRNALNMRGDVTVTVVAGGEQPLAPATSLVNENSHKAFATFEPDYWLMDGSYKFASEDGSSGYMSTELSGSNGNFSTAPILQFDFTDNFDTDGITLYFGAATGDYCDDIDIAFYAGTGLIRTDNYNPTGTTFATGQAVSGFDKIVITFNSTNNPYRFARLVNLDFDTITRWMGDNIKNGRLVEQVSPISLEIPSNEIEFTLHSEDGDFSILNPSNEYQALQENEPIEAYEQIGDVDVFLGRFYLEDWESLSANDARFTAYDAISLLDKPQFYCSVNGIYYYDEMIAKIFETANVDYEIDASLMDVPAWATYGGMLKVMSCREALQQACFALGAYVTCARSRVPQILPINIPEAGDTFDLTLDATNKGLNSPVKLQNAFTALDILAYEYSRIYYTAGNTLWALDDANGTYTVIFETATTPFVWDDDLDTYHTPDDYGRYWIKFTVTDNHDYAVIDAGYFFDERPNRYLIDNNTVPDTTPTNIIIIDGAVLVKDDRPPYSQTLTDTIQHVVSYYLRRIVQDTKTYGINVAAGNTISVQTQGQTIFGIVESAEINLTGGFVAALKIVGTVQKSEQTIMYDDDAARFSYNGFANTLENTGFYGGAIKYSADTESGYVDFFFIGTRFDLLYFQNTSYGSITITIDNEEIETISQAGASTFQKEWNSPEMVNTYHKVRIAKVGTTGIVNIDAVRVYYR